jgi:predicted MFS family arabinose efflux permease
MATTALILHLQRTLGTPTAVGLLLFAQAVPPIAAPFAGAIADRLRPARLLGAGLLAQAALAGILALRLPSLGPLLAIVFLLALVDTPPGAAVGRCIPVAVGDDDLVAANALRGGMRELGTVLGPPLAGLIFAASGARLVLGLDALTFLLAVPLVLGLPEPGPEPGGEPGPPPGADARPARRFLGDVRQGLAIVVRTPSLLAIAAGFWVVVFFTAPDDLILPFLATTTFRSGPVAVGVLLAAASVGLLVGLPLVGPLGRRLGATAAIVAGFAVMATGNLLTAASPWLAGAFAAQMLRGLAIPLADSHVTTHIQRTVPPQLLGRVLSNVYGGVAVAAAAGYLVGGPVLRATSPRTSFVIVGCGGLIGTAACAILLRRAGRPSR